MVAEQDISERITQVCKLKFVCHTKKTRSHRILTCIHMAYTQIINIYQRVIYTHGTSKQLLVKFLQPAQLADTSCSVPESRQLTSENLPLPTTGRRGKVAEDL